MGKVTVKVRMWNFRDEPAVRSGEVIPIEVEAVADSGAFENVISPALAQRLGLIASGEKTVVFAGGEKVKRPVALGLRIEALGRDALGAAIVDPAREVPLIGQLFLEATCLLVDCRGGRLVPDPAYGGEQVCEILAATAAGSGGDRVSRAR